MENVQFIMISHEELISLLMMCGYSNGLAGASISEFDLNEDEKLKYIQSNQKKLFESGFLHTDEKGDVIMDQDIAHLLYILMNHQLAYIMIRMFPEQNREEQVVYEICGKDILEHYHHKNGMHRFTIIPTPEDLYYRLKQLIPITDFREEDPEIYKLPEDTMKQIVDQVKNGKTEVPLNELLETGMPIELAENCINGIKSPEVVVSIMGIVYEDQLAIRVSSISAFVNNDSLWGIWPIENEAYKESTQKEIALFECVQSDIILFFKNWIDMISEMENNDQQ